MTPVVRHMILCDDVRIDPDEPSCTHVDCLMGTIVSLEDPAFPLIREMICVYLVLTGCIGKGVAQIRVAYVDGERDEPLFGSPPKALDFAGHSPAELLAVAFRLQACPFPRAGQYSVQFWYDQQKVHEQPLRIR